MSNAVDFVLLDEEGSGYRGDPRREKAWYGFGEPVLAPADGTVVSVSDIHPDEPVGNTGQKPSYATTSSSTSAVDATPCWRTSSREALG